LMGNVIHSDIISVQSYGNYQYDVVDLNGNIITKGELSNGTNKIKLPVTTPGIYILRTNGNNQQWIEKLLRP